MPVELVGVNRVRKTGAKNFAVRDISRTGARSIFREAKAWLFRNIYARSCACSRRIEEMPGIREFGLERAFVAWAPQPEFNFRKPEV